MILINLRQITGEDIVQWSSEKNIEMLLFASNKGNHQTRLKSMNHLGRMIKNRDVRIALITLMDDPILSIAAHASNVIQSNILSRELEVDKSFNEAIKRLNDRIEYQENMTSYFSSIKSTKKPLRTSKKDMKRLEAVKKALRRSIR